MIDVHELPIPDWGLRCPHCDAPLAGLEAYRCGQCGQSFNILQVVGQHRPIPDIGLTCPQCDYLLRGLINQRCPECGTEFRVREMIEGTSVQVTVISSTLADPPDHHIKKREATYTGRERPLPDFGLVCSNCEKPLAGATTDDCPHCQQPFDLPALIRDRDWVDISPYIHKEMRMLANPTLYGAQVPYLMDNAGFAAAYGSDLLFTSRRVRVPREFFFDALAALASTRFDETGGQAGEWRCSTCGEAVPADFDICWNCNECQPNPKPSDEGSD